MKFVMIGTGNVATILGSLFVKSGHEILQVYGRNSDKVGRLARLFKCSGITDLSRLEESADFYLIAVSDDAIPGISSQLQLKDRLIVHTAGSVSKSVLKGISSQYGVFYPLQSLQMATSGKPEIPVLIDASSAESLERLKVLASSIGSQYQVCNDTQRQKMHLAAVWVNNFPNLLYAIAFRICQEESLDFRFLRPLIQETADRINGEDPVKWQTGPAIRNDTKTLATQQLLLANHPDWQLLYNEMTRLIQDFSKP